jgi:hypothetical protein
VQYLFNLQHNTTSIGM